MARTQAKKVTIATSGWLPGFEPQDYLIGTAGLTILTSPPMAPTPVGLVSAVVVNTSLAQLPAPVPQRRVIEAVYADLAGQEQHHENQEIPEVVQQTVAQSKVWMKFHAERCEQGGTVAQRIDRNLAAIELMLKLRADKTMITDEHRHTLLAYSGWGGAARLFETVPSVTMTSKREHLKSLVSDEEFSSARASVTSSFYTDPVVIDAIWDIARRLGFRGGRVIEPTAGTGLFLAGMPTDMALASEITAEELDKLSSELLGTVFGGLGVKVHSSAIEKAPIPDGFYDLAISNVPFGEHKSLETRKVGYSEWSIHNYCIGKAIDLVRPGGLVLVITSSFTMDSQSMGHRDWINAHAELLGAIRLPDTAFKKSAATEVVTDILVFKKRSSPTFAARNPWKRTTQASASMMCAGQCLTTYSSISRKEVDKNRIINEWFVENPHMVLGELKFQSGQYGRETLTTVFQGDGQEFKQRLNKAVQCMPEGVYQTRPQEVHSEPSWILNTVDATSKVKPGGFIVDGSGRICISQDERSWLDVNEAFKGKSRERILGMIGIKEVARKLVQAQISSNDDASYKVIQTQLNIRYDAFVSKYGHMSDSANVRLFRSDPDCPLVLSLESYDEETETFKKADIFTRRTAGKKEPPAHVSCIKDALLVSLGLYGRIHLRDMATRMTTSVKQVVQNLFDSDLAYIDPNTGYWLPAEEYLSGNIRHKINEANAAGKKYERNLSALKSVIPDDLGPAQVEVRLGAPWVPTDVVAKFVKELVGFGSNESLDVSYSAESATWSIKTSSNHEYAGDRTLNFSKWGTMNRCAITLVEAALNQVPPKITRTVNGKSILDRSATLAAREKYEAIRVEFKNWAYRDDARRDRLLRIYNDEFNQIVERKYDGSHLVLYGLSPVVVPYAHQLDAIWRIVSGGNTLLAHVVGAGKTLTMIAAAMEMRRIGKANKPAIVVPNHLLAQIVGDCVRFYPTAKVLMATKDDFSGDKRKEFVARIATGDWDAVVMTHSTFERIPTSPRATKDFVDELLKQTRNSLQMAEESGAKRTVKQCEKILKAMESKVERALNEDFKDDLVYFDELGIDYLMFDEAQALKNLMRVSKMPQIAGLSNASSNRSFDAWIKTAMIMRARGDQEQGLTFASATPISNSLAEAHVMQKFLQPYTLKRMGLYEFDAWAGTFGESVQGMEVAPDGGGYRLSTRFSRFTNVPDLMAIFKMVADIKTRSMVSLPTPAIYGGKPSVVVSPASQALLDYTKTLVERAQEIRNGSVKPEDDNMLAITNCGRKAALDMRLVDPLLPFDPQGKIAKAVVNIMRIWHATAAQRGTQMVFCDLSTPSAIGFSVYNDLRQRLIDAGMPADEIAFIHDFKNDAAKDDLFRQVRAGKIRLLMGSTLKLGTGTNAQKRLAAVHQLDAPWRPSDVEQRDGRGLRAGNMWEVIELIRYVTQGSFDAYIWSLLETKAKFIEQVMTASSSMRTVEDLSMGALTFAEIKAIASGNPLVIEKATIDAQVMKLVLLRESWEQDRWQMSRMLKNNQQILDALSESMEAVEKDARIVSNEMLNGLVFVDRYGKRMSQSSDHSLQTQLGKAIYETSRSHISVDEVTAGTIGGMKVILSRYDGLQVALRSQNDPRIQYAVRRDGVHINDAFGTGKLVVDLLEKLVDEPDVRRSRMSRLTAECERARSVQFVGFEHEQELSALICRQRAIESELDLDKDEEGAVAVQETATV